MTRAARYRRHLAERLIEVAVPIAQRLGATLVRENTLGVWWNQESKTWDLHAQKQVCLCGAIAFALQPEDHGNSFDAIARKLRITKMQVNSLSDGYEGFTPGGANPALTNPRTVDRVWWRIGRKWRERLQREERRKHRRAA